VTNNIDRIKSMKIRVIEANLKALNSTEYARFQSLSDKDKEEYVHKNWVKFQVRPAKESLERMNALLHPLLRVAVDKGLTDLIGNELVAGMGRKMMNILEFHEIMIRLAAAVPDRVPKETIQLHFPSYLMLFEGAFTEEVNLVAYLLAVSGKEFYRRKRGSKVPVPISSYRQMQSMRMRDKFNYLAEGGFDFVIEAGDYDLRNSIAHCEYDLSTDGIFCYARQGHGSVSLSLEEMDSKHETLLQHAACFQRSALQFYVDFVKSAFSIYPEPVRKELLNSLGFHFDELEKP